jgi:hypothetical protein
VKQPRGMREPSLLLMAPPLGPLMRSGYPPAARRLCAAPGDVKTVAPPDRQAPLDRQLRLLKRAVGEHPSVR